MSEVHAEPAQSPARRMAWMTLLVLTGLNLLNYLDRYVLSALVTELEHAPADGGLGLTSTEAGWLYSGFIIVYMCASPIFGALADRYSRGRLLGFGVALWSVATAAGALAGGFGTLLLSRVWTGVGEAAYATVAPSVLADHFDEKKRSRALAVFNSAIPIGAALGFVTAGLVLQYAGWREALLVAGAPGLILALVFVWLPEPRRGAADAPRKGAVRSAPDFRKSLGILRRPPFLLCSLGYAAQTAGFGALGFWAPSYLELGKGMSNSQATTTFGLLIVTTGFIGSIGGGCLGDWWRARNPNGLVLTCIWSTLLAIPGILLSILAHDPFLVWAGLALGSVALVASVGPVNSQLVNLLDARERATGMALAILVLHLFGDVPSVPFVGWLEDHASFDIAFGFIPLVLLLAAGLWGLALRAGGNPGSVQTPVHQ